MGNGQFLQEYGSSYKAGASVRVALVFPDSYYLGMSSLGFQVILDEINRHPDVSCERVFFDESDRIPRSLETRRLLSEFDIIGFSISFELDYINVVKILNAAGIPLRAKDRGAAYPLVIAGGICPTYNPEPLSDFVDAFVIGDGEEVIHTLISEYQSWLQQKNEGWQDFHYRLSRIKGVYVPLLYDVTYKEDGTLSGIHPQVEGVAAKPIIERASVNGLDEYDTMSKILTPNTEFPCTFLVEITRGCAHRCRFCVASYVQKCMIRSKESILRLCQSDLAKNAEKIGLLGSSVSDHPQIDEIAASLVGMGNKISIASLRADSVSDTLLDALAASGQKTITLAPEAATARLRKAISKDMPLETTFKVIKSAVKRGIVNVKLYFMIGLPTETQEDVESIVTVLRTARQVMFGSSRPRVSESPCLIVSIASFVPKPHTPFQWCQMEDVKILSRKLQFLNRRLRMIGGVRVTYSSTRLSAIQGVLARGDRRLANALYDIGKNVMSWNQALKKNNIKQDFYLQRPRKIDELFPWDIMNPVVSKAKLLESYNRHY